MSRLLPRAFALASVAALLSACSSLDAKNPGSWIDTIAGGGSETSAEAKTAPPPPSVGDKPPPVSSTTTTTASSAGTTSSSSDQPKASSLPTERAAGTPVDYPNLSEQPDLQTPGTSESQRREIRDSLVQDRDEAQHSAETLRGGTAAAAPPPPTSAKPAEGKPAAGKPADGKPADEKPAEGEATDAKPAEGSDSSQGSGN